MVGMGTEKKGGGNAIRAHSRVSETECHKVSDTYARQIQTWHIKYLFLVREATLQNDDKTLQKLLANQH